MSEKKQIVVHVGGCDLIFETGVVALQANGSVMLRAGDTVLFAAATAATAADPNCDFLPLRVDYQANLSAAGKTAGGFIKRQGRPSESEILTSRMIDRPLRPLFEEGYYVETQILSYVWSYDGVHPTEPLAICAASAALVISDIPLKKPVASVRVGFVSGHFVVNPTIQQMKESRLDLMLAGTEDAILMIEGYSDFLTEEEMLQAIAQGHAAIQTICRALAQWAEAIGKAKKRDVLRPPCTDLISRLLGELNVPLTAALRIPEKKKREEALDQVEAAFLLAHAPQGDSVPSAGDGSRELLAAFKEVKSQLMRRMIVEEGLRADGRSPDDIRQISSIIDFLPRTHGSSLFTRGETQAVAVCTLGGENMAQRYETLEGENTHRFYLHYFFPPFSVGEVGRVGSPGRRELGHGELAKRALAASLPDRASFPYVVRIESTITASNGSSSMATVCGGCLAMMNAGVPIKRPVAGIAMGLVLLEDGRFTVLSDILGIEDALGDMDFKVAGDQQGITAFQMDIKVEGITIDIMREALGKAKKGRIHILSKMLEVCPKHREQPPAHAPRIETFAIKPSKIAIVIGPGGKQIRKIIEETSVAIDIDDAGNVTLVGEHLAAIEKARAIIDSLTAEIEIGRSYLGKVAGITPFGVFVEILPGKQGLCHISEYDHEHIADLNTVVAIGDELLVKVLDINERGQIRLSRKALLASPKGGRSSQDDGRNSR